MESDQICSFLKETENLNLSCCEEKEELCNHRAELLQNTKPFLTAPVSILVALISFYKHVNTIRVNLLQWH